MPRSAVPARPHRRRARTAVVVSALAVLALALPVGLAHADVATGPLTGTVGPAAANGVMTIWQRVDGTWTRFGFADIDADGDYTTDVPVGGTYAVTYDDADLGEHDVNADGALGRPRDTQGGTTVPDALGATLDFPFPQLTASLTVGSVTDGGVAVTSPSVALYALADEGDGAGWLTLDATPAADAITGSVQFSGLPAGTYAAALPSTADDHLYLADGTRVLAWDTHPATDGSFGLALASASHRSIAIALGHTPPPVYFPPVDPSPTPSTSPTPSSSPSPAPSTPAKPSPSSDPTPAPVRIDPASPPSALQLNIPATPQIAIVPGARSVGSASARDQDAVNNALLNALSAAQQQAMAAALTPPTGPTVQANLVPTPAAMPPGLYVQVIDGLINVTNKGGAASFQAGQFGFVPSFQTPPIILPSNPGLKFSPPPVFTTGVSTTISHLPVDCEVRRTATTEDKTPDKDGLHATSKPTPSDAAIKKTYCNRIAAPRAGVPSKHHSHHQAWKRHVTATVKHGKSHVRTPALRVPGPGWYRIVTTHHVVLRFTAISDHGKRPSHPIHVTRTAAIRSITYVHVTRP